MPGNLCLNAAKHLCKINNSIKWEKKLFKVCNNLYYKLVQIYSLFYRLVYLEEETCVRSPLAMLWLQLMYASSVHICPPDLKSTHTRCIVYKTLSSNLYIQERWLWVYVKNQKRGEPVYPRIVETFLVIFLSWAEQGSINLTKKADKVLLKYMLFFSYFYISGI